MPHDTTPDPEDPQAAYARFGAQFFHRAVSEARILDGLSGLAGNRIEFGPIGAGPGKLARVSAMGEVGTASATRISGELVVFRLSIPVELDLHIDLGVDQSRFHVTVTVGLTLTARPADPLRVLIEVDTPTSQDVSVAVEAEGLRASVLQRVAGIDREIGRFVARYVERELDKPHIQAARDIDIGARIDLA